MVDGLRSCLAQLLVVGAAPFAAGVANDGGLQVTVAFEKANNPRQGIFGFGQNPGLIEREKNTFQAAFQNAQIFECAATREDERNGMVWVKKQLGGIVDNCTQVLLHPNGLEFLRFVSQGESGAVRTPVQIRKVDVVAPLAGSQQVIDFFYGVASWINDVLPELVEFTNQKIGTYYIADARAIRRHCRIRPIEFWLPCRFARLIRRPLGDLSGCLI